MNRRRLLATVGAGVAAGCAGCGGLLSGDSCGPGETEIRAVAAEYGQWVGERVTVRGEVVEREPSYVQIRDPTGDALSNLLGYHYDVGTCLSVDALVVRADRFREYEAEEEMIPSADVYLLESSVTDVGTADG